MRASFLLNASLAFVVATCGIAASWQRGRQPSAAVAAPLVAETITRPAAVPAIGSPTLTVSYIDIGQGDAELLQTKGGSNVLIDTGPPAGRDALLAYLKKQGIKKLDVVMISHPHLDHFGNAPEVFEAVPTTEVIDSGFNTGSPAQERMLRSIQAHKIKFSIAPKTYLGKERDLGDGVKMKVFAPETPYLTNPNNNSVVALITAGKVKFLFTGDEEDEERDRLYKSGVDISADIYKAAHHGSRNGTDDTFMSKVKPKEAVISCGIDNSYGHPHKEAMNALSKAGVRTWRTDKQGTIVVTTDGTNYAVNPVGKAVNADLPKTEPAPLPSPVRLAQPQADLLIPADKVGMFIGNKRSKIYHKPGSGHLPSEANRVYFETAEEAEAAGYRAAKND